MTFIPDATHKLMVKRVTGELEEIDLVETATGQLFMVLETDDLKLGTSDSLWIEPIAEPPV